MSAAKCVPERRIENVMPVYQTSRKSRERERETDAELSGSLHMFVYIHVD